MVPRIDVDGLADDQAAALLKLWKAHVGVITGAPGTGKTHLIRRVLSSLLTPGERVAMAAPTGKAAKRMMEQTGVEATTIHRLLEPQIVRGKFYFNRNSENPLEYDVVVLDESSMIDVSLMASFIDALPLRTRLLIIGDTNQLPSVGAGNVLQDTIASGVIETAELTTIKRQDAGLIIRNCHAIRDGRNITIDNEGSNDFFWDEWHDVEDIATAVVDLVARRLPGHKGFNPIRDIQVITPRANKHDLSAPELNKRLQAVLNPNKPAENARFAVGDKVLQTKNDYSLGIYNGDVGIMTDIDTKAKTYTVIFESPEREVVIEWKRAELDLGYAVTIHKAQGSEWPAVVIPVHPSMGFILQRNLLYTAISRAREMCVCVGQSAEVPKIINRQAQSRRHTHLERLLRNGK